jgi:hypothetical protein
MLYFFHLSLSLYQQKQRWQKIHFVNIFEKYRSIDPRRKDSDSSTEAESMNFQKCKRKKRGILCDSMENPH